jgi:hypothetical protein
MTLNERCRLRLRTPSFGGSFSHGVSFTPSKFCESMSYYFARSCEAALVRFKASTPVPSMPGHGAVAPVDPELAFRERPASGQVDGHHDSARADAFAGKISIAVETSIPARSPGIAARCAPDQGEGRSVFRLINDESRTRKAVSSHSSALAVSPR